MHCDRYTLTIVDRRLLWPEDSRNNCLKLRRPGYSFSCSCVMFVLNSRIERRTQLKSSRSTQESVIESDQLGSRRRDTQSRCGSILYTSPQDEGGNSQAQQDGQYDHKARFPPPD